MSIHDEIRQRVAEGRLVEFVPIPPMSRYRMVFLEPNVNARIVGPWPAGDDDEVEMPRVRADLENFIVKGMVTATLRRTPNANFKRLQDQARKVWEIRILDPKPGNRLFGFFAAQDVYVGTELIRRDEVDIAADIRNAKTAWRSLFGSYEPIVSEDIYDYISESVVELHKR